VEGIDYEIFEELSRHVPGETEKNQEYPEPK
jgi:hypothetical protein